MFFLWISNLIFAEYTKHAFPIVLVLPGWKRPFLSLDVNLKQIASELIQNIWCCCSCMACLLYTRSGSDYNCFEYPCLFFRISDWIFAEYKKNALPIVLVMTVWKRPFLNLDVIWKRTVSELLQNNWWCCSSKTCLLYTKSGSNYNIFSISVFFLWISNLIFAENKKNALPIVIAILVFLNINLFFMWISNLIFAEYK